MSNIRVQILSVVSLWETEKTLTYIYSAVIAFFGLKMLWDKLKKAALALSLFQFILIETRP